MTENISAVASTNMNSASSTAKDDMSKLQPKAKGKRPASPSAPASASKKPNNHSSPTSEPETHLAYKDLSLKWLDALPVNPENKKQETLRLIHHTGDMFSAPPSTLLIHACNTQGHWGAGIALAFKTRYPAAYAAHRDFCTKEHSKQDSVPTGTAQLLAPVDNGQHWIGCLFTSKKYGKAKDKPDVILRNTEMAVQMLLELVKMKGAEVGDVRMCKVNSGKFGVEWERTEEVLKGIVLREGWRGEIEVWEP
jgi:ADP-ribose 1''-phosphate phosphatase